MKNVYLRNSEVVLKGHPDRMCDKIAKKIADLIWHKDKMNGRSACELLYNGDNLIIAGEYKTSFSREELEKKFEEIAKDCISKQTTKMPKIMQIWNSQSAEINKASQKGFGDNSIAYGYYNETTNTNKTPVQKYLENVAENIERHHSKEWPDGKIIMINGELSVSIEKGIDEKILNDFKNVTVFDKSGGFADTGVVGRKLIAEGPGNGIPHGGGAKLGKDLTKGDRSLKILGDLIAKEIGEKEHRNVLLQLSCVFGSDEITIIDVYQDNKNITEIYGSKLEIKEKLKSIFKRGC